MTLVIGLMGAFYLLCRRFGESAHHVSVGNTVIQSTTVSVIENDRTCIKTIRWRSYMNAVKTFTVGAVALGMSISVAMAADIVDTAVAAGSFNTLVAAVKAADLAGTLKGPGPFTVFAPTDAAFKKLPKGTVANLLKPENKDKLVKVLTYHVLSGEVPSSAIAGKRLSATTVEGQRLNIDGRHGVKINMAHVVKADIPADNGVIHVIDEVLLPKM
jgi:uncharacterized surface protein with fasciclin (FAS1) repeats